MRRARLGPALVLALALLPVVGGPLTAQYRSGGYGLSYGSYYAGGSVNTYGSLYRSSGYSRAYGRISGFVRLLGSSREAGRVTATAYQSQWSGGGSSTIRIGGYTVWSASLWTSGSRGFYNLLNVFPYSPSTTVWVGPVPVTLQGNVGAGVSLGLSWTLVPSTVSAGLGGYAQAWGYGSASAAVGVPGYNAGLQLALNFARQRLAYGMTATSWGLYGNLGYEFYPIGLFLDVVVNAWPWQWSHNLASYSTSGWSTGNLLN